jgi:hypothetical protein
MLRYLGCAGLGLLVLVIASASCGVGGVGASPYQSGWYYPYYPWYWGGLYNSYGWNNTHYIEYHGGYTRNGTLAPGYSYDPAANVVRSRFGQPVFPNPRGVDDIKPQSNVPNPRTLSNAPDSIKSASGGCSGQNSCTGGGNAVTNKSGGNSPPGNGGSSCSGQANCTGGGNAITNKPGGSSNQSDADKQKTGSGSNSSSNGSASSSGQSKPSSPPKPSGPSKPSRPSRPSGGGKR